MQNMWDDHYREEKPKNVIYREERPYECNIYGMTIAKRKGQMILYMWDNHFKEEIPNEYNIYGMNITERKGQMNVIYVGWP